MKLKEDRSEWEKLAVLLYWLVCGLAMVMGARHRIPHLVFLVIACAATTGLVLLLSRADWSRAVYRVWMSAGWGMSQVVGQALLGLMFLAMVVPIGVLLRAMGKDPLLLKPGSRIDSYWQPGRNSGNFDRLF